MGFRFPLAAVLRYRETVERREELALQAVQMQIAVARRAVEQLNTHIASAHQAREDCMRQTIPAVQLRAMLVEIEAAQERKAALLATLRALEQTCEEQSKRYQAAHQARQMLSDMAGRQKDAWEQEMARAQQKFLDDIFGSRSQRG